MLDNFDVYEKELKKQIAAYNKAVKTNNLVGAVFIYNSIICPLVIKYRKALWANNIINSTNIFRVDLANQPFVIYLASSRRIDSLKKWDTSPELHGLYKLDHNIIHLNTNNK